MSNVPKLVRDLMTREVVTVYEEENLEKLLAGMDRLGFHHLPVVDGKKLVGMVTRTDLLAASVSRLMPRTEESEHQLEENVFVAQIMNRDVPTASPDTPLETAAEQIWKAKLSCLPVVDASGELVGILTTTDFVHLTMRLMAR